MGSEIGLAGDVLKFFDSASLSALPTCTRGRVMQVVEESLFGS